MKKNVMLITFDQWSAANMGCAGNNSILTPTLDELSRCGIRYTNAYSCTPVCIPARRELMLGVSAKTHGDRCQSERKQMPHGLPTLATVFHDQGYQTFAVGKLHVFPQRNRIGFDDVILNEEGRHLEGLLQDDYERFLSLNGYHGQEFAHGMCNNNYMYRPFPLAEKFHPTTWTASQMCEIIKRKDPTRPAFWYLSFTGPHPPLIPPRDYLEIYNDIDIEQPYSGFWADEKNGELPYSCKYYQNIRNVGNETSVRKALKAVYATCTHIDHQIRTVIGTLSECGFLQDTIILITADHGDMLGKHGIWCKNLFFEDSCKTPFLLIPDSDSCPPLLNTIDNRLVTLMDVMPSLCALAGIDIPATAEGTSVLSDKKRDWIYGELWEDKRTTRMVTDGKHKLIYYGYDNKLQLFDLQIDPCEMHNYINDHKYEKVKEQLCKILIENFYGDDLFMLKDGGLVGMADRIKNGKVGENFHLNKWSLLSQRGIR
jgi:arylsulfatase A-like enzyme